MAAKQTEAVDHTLNTSWVGRRLYGDNALTAAFIAVVILSYFWLGFTPNHEATYNLHAMLGEGFLKLNTYVDYSVSPELLQSKDPYAPAEHRGRSLWDASLYSGKYYVYFGPVPALLLWVPFKLILGISLSTSALTVIFASIGSACLIILLSGILSIYPRNISRAALLTGGAAICYGTWIPYAVRAGTYEVSISGAYCFIAMGLLLLWVSSRKKESPSYIALAFAGLCFGLAIGCRHLHVLNGLLLIYIWWFMAHKYKQCSFSIALALFLPWLFCIECLMAYNYIRFGNVFETGVHYQLTIDNVHDPAFRFLRPEKFLNNAYYYLIRPLEWKPELTFPPFYTTPGDHTTLFGKWTVEAQDLAYGLLVNSPFVLFLFFRLRTDKAATEIPDINRWIRYSATLYGLIMLLFMLCFVWITLRYAIDFSPWLMLAASLRFAQLLYSSRLSRRYYNLLLLMGIVASLFSAFNGIMLNLSRQI